jgi:hypothetical protein
MNFPSYFRKTLVFTGLLFVLHHALPAQNDSLTLGFETWKSPPKAPLGWDLKSTKLGAAGYRLVREDKVVKKGQFALRISQDSSANEPTLGIATYILNGPFSGRKLVLSGWLKGARISPSGFAGLLVRSENAEGQVLAFDNMEKRQINGSFEWEQFGTQIPLLGSVQRVVIGVVLKGRGVLWADELSWKVE